MAQDRLTVPIRAVIFDLYGTLVPEFPHQDFYASIDHMASVLGADPSAFRDGWNQTVVERQTGVYATMDENVLAICEAMGMPEPEAAVVTRALKRRAEMYDTWFHPREGAVETLAELRARGFALALISMCAPRSSRAWSACASPTRRSTGTPAMRSASRPGSACTAATAPTASSPAHESSA